MFVEKLKEDQIRQIISLISDDDAPESVEIHKRDTGVEVTIISMGMEENYVLHDYFVETFDYAANGCEYIYRKQMLEFFGPPYAERFLLMT